MNSITINEELLLVTIPKSVKLSDIESEMFDSKERDLLLNHKLGKNKPKRHPEYIGLVYNGEVRYIGSLLKYENKSFICETTNVAWGSSWYAVFDEVFEIPEISRPKLKGFQGFRYKRLEIVID